MTDAVVLWVIAGGVFFWILAVWKFVEIVVEGVS